MEQTILINGKIYLERDRFAQALLIEQGRVAAVGDSADLLARAPEATVYDCGGRTVIPGLNDSHMHLLHVAEQMERVNISDCTSVEDLVQRCRAYLETHPNARAHGLHSVGWNQDLFDEPRIPTRQDLDRIATDIPVVLERICGHILSTNTCAIQMLGLTADSPPYPGGTFELGADGQPNGVFTENACRAPVSLIPRPSLEQQQELMLKAMDYAVAHGITSMQSNDAGTSCSIEAGPRFFEMVRQMYARGNGRLRYRHQVCFISPDQFADFLRSGEREHPAYQGDSWLTMGPLKLFKDGSLGARTATMRQEYRDDPGNYGVECTDDRMMREFCRLAQDAGMQVVTHAIGDDAISRTLDAYESVNRHGENPLRHGVIHCQITDRAMLQRMVDSKIPAFFQPIFLDYDMQVLESRVGKELASTSYAFATFPKLGGKVSYGTDSPVEDCNPFPNIYCAVTRMNLKGQPAGGFYPEEKVDIYDAIDAYTQGSAWCEFAEDEKGRLKPGYLADLVVLDTDIFTCPETQIPHILPVMTMVGGHIVFEA